MLVTTVVTRGKPRGLRGQALAGAKQAVAGVPQAREDVTLGVELAVNCGGIDWDGGMRFEHGAHPLGGGDQAHEADAVEWSAGASQGADRGDRGAPGREHRVEQEERPVCLAGGNLEVIVHGLECVVVAVQPDMSDAGGRDELGNSLDHAQPSAQDGYQRELFSGYLAAGSLLEGRFDLDRLQG